MDKDLKYLSDEELYLLLRDKSELSRYVFEELYSRYSSRIYTYCRRILSDSELAEDCFQETFIKFYQCIDNAKEITNVEGFIFKIARNICINEKTKNKIKTIHLVESKFSVNDTRYESKEKSDIVDKAINSLQDDFKEVIIFKELLGMTYAEIAQITNTSEANIRTKLWRAKQKLRVILSAYIEDFNDL